MVRALTAATVKALKPTAQRREIKDATMGLYLVIQPSGYKSFAMRFRGPDGKPTKLVLGPLDLSAESQGDPVIGAPLTLAAARQLAAQVHRERIRGTDVVADRRRKVTRAENTFAQCAHEFIEAYAKPKTRRWRDTASLLGLTPDGEAVRGGLADRWNDKPVTAIDGHAIYSVVEEARTRGVPGQDKKNDGASEARARHLFSALSVLFGWLHRHRRVEANPCIGVHRPEAGRSRDRVLTNTEIQKFWKAADAERFGGLLKLLLLTGCRLNEVAGMRRGELDGATWTIPKERTKNRRPHIVPLAPQVQEIIAGTGDLVFTTTGSTPVSGWSKLKHRLDARMGNPPPWRLHDLRRTCATGMASIGIQPHIIEACLNHISGAKASVAGIYNRHHYEAEKKAALQRWADHVEGLVSGTKSKVVPIRRGKAS